MFKVLNFFVVFGFIGFLFKFFGHFWNLGVVTNFGLFILKTKLVSNSLLSVLVSGLSVVVFVGLIIVVGSVVVVIRSVVIVGGSVVVLSSFWVLLRWLFTRLVGS